MTPPPCLNIKKNALFSRDGFPYQSLVHWLSNWLSVIDPLLIIEASQHNIPREKILQEYLRNTIEILHKSKPTGYQSIQKRPKTSKSVQKRSKGSKRIQSGQKGPNPCILSKIVNRCPKYQKQSRVKNFWWRLFFGTPCTYIPQLLADYIQ